MQLRVADSVPGRYDSLIVAGNANLGGTLRLVSGGFEPKAGNKLTLVTTGGAVLGRFAQFVDPFATGPGFNTVELVYGRNSVLLEFLNAVPPVPPVPPVISNFASFALTPNELAAANLLDAVQLDPRAASLFSFLKSEPVTKLPANLERMSPDGLSAFYEVSFSGANIQKLNLEDRLDDVRRGSSGFSSNVKINGGATTAVEGKATVDGKSSKNLPALEPTSENRWRIWVTGFGDFVSVDEEFNAKGYNFTTGGVSLGVDYRVTDCLALGVMGNYSHTWTDLGAGGHVGVDTGRGGLYATYFHQGYSGRREDAGTFSAGQEDVGTFSEGRENVGTFYLNGGIYGGYNSYDSSRQDLGGRATGSADGGEFSTFVRSGYDFRFGQLTIGPIASLQYTNVYVNGFKETGSLAPMQIHADSEESLRTDLGLRASYQWKVGKVTVEPSLKVAWEHEFKYSALPITAGLAAVPGPAATFLGPSEGHDSAIVIAGVAIQWSPTISTYVNYDGQLGRSRYDSNAVTGGARISF